MTLFIVPTVTFDIAFGFKSGKTCKKIDAHKTVPYQNSECRSYKVMLKAGCRGYGMSGVMGSAGAYDVGARTRFQLIGCALTQEPGVLNFGLRVANNGGRRICGDRKVI